MKRKLDTNDVPTPTSSPQASRQSSPSPSPTSASQPAAKEPSPPIAKQPALSLTFESMGLDSRLLQGIKKLGFEKPTRVQVEAVSKVVEGRDVLARAKTGSGKTGAYVWGILQGILRAKEATKYKQCTSTLILVPTRELADQVYKAIESFTVYCAKDIKVVNIAQKISVDTQRNLLETLPDIVVSTPSRAAENSRVLALETLRWLVIDEADLVLSYGHDKDLAKIRAGMPNTGCQTIMMSATLTDEVDLLKGEFCKNPVVLKLDEKDAEGEGVSQYVVKCAEDEKFLLIYVIFKLKLIKGKCIIFVADIDRCYRLKLYLEQFGIRSCILNSELPVNSRIHVVEEFNKNVYDIIIASDEHEVVGNEGKEKEITEEEEKPKTTEAEDVAEGDGQEAESKATVEPAKKKRKLGKGAKRDKEYGVSRGIDFKNVACVINFDLPTSSKSYIHRIGRTARAGQTGMALSFVIPSNLYHKHKPTSIPTCKDDEVVLKKIIKNQAKSGKEVKPYNFDMKQVDGFRYRMGDALRAVTKVAIREARTRELRQELISSEKLKRHFEENPDDLRHLRHDGELRAARVQAHLRHVPEYLLPKEGREGIVKDVGWVGLRKEGGDRKDRGKGKGGKRGGRGGGGGRAGVRKVNPLKSFKAKRK